MIEEDIYQDVLEGILEGMEATCDDLVTEIDSLERERATTELKLKNSKLTLAGFKEATKLWKSLMKTESS